MRVWLVLGLLFAFPLVLIDEYLGVLSVVPLVLWVVVGVILLFRHLFRVPAINEAYSRRRNVLAVVAGFALFNPVASVGGIAVRWSRFYWNRPEYGRVVAAVQAGKPVHTQLAYTVDPGPPARVAFPWLGGIIDNWCGVVFDPTKAVLEVNLLTVGSSQWRAHPIAGLFEGDMTGCSTLVEPYYLCCFT